MFEVWSGLLVFVQIVMVFGEVGHTHDRMDAMFGIFSQKLQHMDCLSPHDLRKIIMKYGKHNEMDNSWAYGARVAADGSPDFRKCGVPVVTFLKQVLDTKTLAEKCKVEDGMHNQKYQHSFQITKVFGSSCPVLYWKSRASDTEWAGPATPFKDPSLVRPMYPLLVPLRSLHEVGGDGSFQSLNGSVVGFLGALQDVGNLSEVTMMQFKSIKFEKSVQEQAGSWDSWLRDYVHRLLADQAVPPERITSLLQLHNIRGFPDRPDEGMVHHDRSVGLDLLRQRYYSYTQEGERVQRESARLPEEQAPATQLCEPTSTLAFLLEQVADKDTRFFKAMAKYQVTSTRRDRNVVIGKQSSRTAAAARMYNLSELRTGHFVAVYAPKIPAGEERCKKHLVWGLQFWIGRVKQTYTIEEQRRLLEEDQRSAVPCFSGNAGPICQVELQVVHTILV